MKRICRPYWEWEDHGDGMYSIPVDIVSEIMAARSLLSDEDRLMVAMRIVVDAWPMSAEHQLTNLEQNRRAWLGQAACRFTARATAIATRAAWPQLTDRQRRNANRIADQVILEWEEDYTDAQTLFR